MADNKTQIVITAKDETRAAIASAQSALEGLHQTASRFSFGGLTAGLTVLASGSAFVGAINNAISFAASLDDMSERTGASVEALSGLAKVAKIGGHDLGLVESGLIRLSKALAGNDDEAKGAAHALDVLGLSAKELQNLDTGDALQIVAERLAEFKDGSGKTALAMDLLGKSGAQLLPLLKDMAEMGRQNASVTSEQAAQAEQYEKNMKKLSASTGGLVKSLTMDLIPALTSASDAMLRLARPGGAGEEIHVDWFDNLFVGMAQRVSEATLALSNFRTEVFKSLGLDKLAADSQASADKIAKALDNVLVKKTRLMTDQNAVSYGYDPFAPPEKKSLKGYKSNTGAAGGRQKDGEDPEIARRDEMIRMAKEADKALEDLQKERDRREKDLDQRLRAMLGGTTSYKLAEYEKQRQALRDALQIGEIDTSQFEEAMAKIDESITKLTDDGKDKFKDLERAIDGWGKSSAKALADFVTEGKASFGDLARSIINDLLQMAIYQNITKPLFDGIQSSGIFSGIGEALGFGGGRANGGPVIPGQYYVVGENGPEVLVPGTSGTVIPNGVGGGGVVINVNNTASGVEATATARTNDGQTIIDVVVERVRGAMVDDARVNGPVTQAMAATFGLGRRAY